MIPFLIRCLLRCYPRAWRERYGAEFAALLEASPLTLGRLLDAVCSATDAHGRQWRRRLMAILATRTLDEEEQRFWRRWVLYLLFAGVLIGLVSRLVPLGLAVSGFFAADQRAIGGKLATLPLGLNSGQWWGLLTEARELVAMPFLGLIALGLGVVQWRALRLLLPLLSRWWIAMALIGPLVALAIMTTDRSYSRFTDLISMTRYFSSYLGQATSPTVARPTDFYTLAFYYLLPTATFAGIAAACQAYLLKGAIGRAGWWIVVAMLAAIAGLATARVFAALRTEGYRLGPEVIRPDLLAFDSGVVIVQLGAACAVYGIVSVLGLIALRRGQRAPIRQAVAGD
jgi:hypothetical protein